MRITWILGKSEISNLAAEDRLGRHQYRCIHALIPLRDPNLNEISDLNGLDQGSFSWS